MHPLNRASLLARSAQQIAGERGMNAALLRFGNCINMNFKPSPRRVHEMSGRLQNQVAWVSGAASGMGEGIARLFAREGAAVALADVQAAKGAAVAEQIRAEGGRAIFIECDVAKEAAIRASIERTEKEFGGLQVIVNCAGIVQIKLLHELDEADWDRLMDINVKSIFL